MTQMQHQNLVLLNPMAKSSTLSRTLWMPSDPSAHHTAHNKEKDVDGDRNCSNSHCLAQQKETDKFSPSFY